MRMLLNNLQRQKTILILNVAKLLYFLSMGIAWSFALFMWWFFETKAFCAPRKKAKIG